MAIELTEAQQKALDAHRGGPLPVVDPRTRETYVLLNTGVFERLRNRGDDEDIQGVRAMYPHYWQIMREDWEDPAMDVYDTYPPTIG